MARIAGRGIRNAWQLLRTGQLGAKFSMCPVCGPTLLVRLARDSISVRCTRCRASGIHMSIVQVLQRLYPDLSALAVYEMSSRGPLFDYLKRRAGRLTCSEYFDDVAPGHSKDGVQCQDVERLTYSSSAFDLCTSTEVFEHVPDDEKGLPGDRARPQVGWAVHLHGAAVGQPGIRQAHGNR